MSILLPFDIETIPDQRSGAFDRYVAEVQPPGQYKKQDSIDKWLSENAETVAAENYQKTALNGLHGEICSVSWALNDGEIKSLTRGLDGCDSEGRLLEWFWDSLRVMTKELTPSGDYARLQWIGHNVIGFDLRFLKQRSIVNGIKPPFLVPADARHGEYAFDTMIEWCGQYGQNRYVSQDALCEALGIEAPEDLIVPDIDGSMVWDLYKTGEYETIAKYNRLDVWKVRQLHRRMTYE